ncbi:Hypothetical protein F387_00944 [Wohlfahrtiimonas chitiniclastica SH04]|uniref:Type II secretion system protein H n=1 Tax=Wohlfahrtiimonas chitiniclastica SH04 TaxID=1261130 RepID=L8XYS3_9GAMM|nr:GspH/FimT family pseudopilin [Wohlfahrtiimonas chitiniclastica]ELV09052.1 Hypothetical protein F387_00944 [Wohlfahrtiimonas chitiniclastica SH04]
MMRPTNDIKGVTLLELMVLVGIFSLIALFSLPNLTPIFARRQLHSALITLEQDLRFAKLTSNHQKQTISMCVSIDQRTCVKTPTRDWRSGWIVFMDREGSFNPAPDDILRRRQGFDPQLHILSTQTILHGLSFNAGKRNNKGLGTGLANGSFTLCHAQVMQSHKIIINIYGRIRTETSETACAL